MREGKKYSFGLLIRYFRKKYGFSMEQLCKGICTFQELSYLEKGDRTIDVFLQDVLLERLGIGAEEYEHYWNYIEYDCWVARQRILYYIVFRDISKAQELLEQYQSIYACKKDSCNVRSRLERQFCLSMSAQICRYVGGSDDELRVLFQEAVYQTVPTLGTDSIAGLVLSIKELNLILEIEKYREEGERPERYKEILEYIISGRLNNLEMAKIYPKAVFYLYQCLAGRRAVKLSKDVEEYWKKEILLKYCNRALDILRDSKRMYFLWEILTARGQILEELAKELANRGNEKEANVFIAIGQENEEWKLALEEIYAEYKVPKETDDYCYLYFLKRVNCINDVVVMRREMLEMSRKELCMGICDEKTLGRLERKENVSQRAIVTELFKRVGVSVELVRIESLTGGETRDFMLKVKGGNNLKLWDQTNQIEERLKYFILTDKRYSRQVMMCREVLSRWYHGKLSNKELCSKMQTILELSVPYNAFLRGGRMFLTYEEQICIQNRMMGMDREDKEFLNCIRRLDAYYESYMVDMKMIDDLYELMMEYVGSEWGVLGYFDRAEQYNISILERCLRFRRMGAIHRCLYRRWWNWMQREKNSIGVDEELYSIQKLSRCILFSALIRDEAGENFYKMKLKSI